jgi:hypothetical protein
MISRTNDLAGDAPDSYTRGRIPRLDVPKFDGDQLKLWQIQCEDYFEMY